MGSVFIVHHVDTEGPLKEDRKDLFQRLKLIFGIDLAPTDENVHKLQRKEIALNGLEDQVALVLDPHTINFMETWDQIDNMLSRVMAPSFRNRMTDSAGKGWIFNWHCMDHVGFIENPRHREMGHFKIFNYFEKLLEKSENSLDRIHWHFHPIHFRRAAHLPASSYTNSYQELNAVVNRRLIEKAWFPVVNRAGFHTVRPDSHAFLEQWIPFDPSNQAVLADQLPKAQLDLALGRFGDWRWAPADWSMYRPDPRNYQVAGSGRRVIARVLNMKARHRSISLEEVEAAFKKASLGEDVYLGITNHDCRDMEPEITEFQDYLKTVAQKFPDVKFLFSEAVDAFQKILYSQEEISQNKLSISLEIQTVPKRRLLVKIDQGELFGPQPWLALKTKKSEYFHDNFDMLIPGKLYSYVFDEYTLPWEEILTIGVASNDKYGNQAIQVIQNS